MPWKGKEKGKGDLSPGKAKPSPKNKADKDGGKKLTEAMDEIDYLLQEKAVRDKKLQKLADEKEELKKRLSRYDPCAFEDSNKPSFHTIHFHVSADQATMVMRLAEEYDALCSSEWYLAKRDLQYHLQTEDSILVLKFLCDLLQESYESCKWLHEQVQDQVIATLLQPTKVLTGDQIPRLVGSLIRLLYSKPNLQSVCLLGKLKDLLEVGRQLGSAFDDVVKDTREAITLFLSEHSFKLETTKLANDVLQKVMDKYKQEFPGIFDSLDLKQALSNSRPLQVFVNKSCALTWRMTTIKTPIDMRSNVFREELFHPSEHIAHEYSPEKPQSGRSYAVDVYIIPALYHGESCLRRGHVFMHQVPGNGFPPSPSGYPQQSPDGTEFMGQGSFGDLTSGESNGEPGQNGRVPEAEPYDPNYNPAYDPNASPTRPHHGDPPRSPYQNGRNISPPTMVDPPPNGRSIRPSNNSFSNHAYSEGPYDQDQEHQRQLQQLRSDQKYEITYPARPPDSLPLKPDDLSRFGAENKAYIASPHDALRASQRLDKRAVHNGQSTYNDIPPNGENRDVYPGQGHLEGQGQHPEGQARNYPDHPDGRNSRPPFPGERKVNGYTDDSEYVGLKRGVEGYTSMRHYPEPETREHENHRRHSDNDRPPEPYYTPASAFNGFRESTRKPNYAPLNGGREGYEGDPYRQYTQDGPML